MVLPGVPIRPVSVPAPVNILVLPPLPPALFANDAGDGQASATDALAENVAGPVHDIPASALAGLVDPSTQLAGGLVTQVPAPTAPESIKRLSSLGDDYSNWGNEGLW